MSDVEHVEASVLAGPVPLAGWSTHVSEVTEVVSSEVIGKRLEGGSRAPPVVVGSVVGSGCGGISAGSRVRTLTVGPAGRGARVGTTIRVTVGCREGMAVSD